MMSASVVIINTRPILHKVSADFSTDVNCNSLPIKLQKLRGESLTKFQTC